MLSKNGSVPAIGDNLRSATRLHEQFGYAYDAAGNLNMNGSCVNGSVLTFDTLESPASPPRCLKLFALQNRHRRRVILRVAEAEVKFRAAAPLEKFLSVVVQNDERLARCLAPHFEVLPAEMFADPRAERFGDGLLGREACGEKRRRVPV